MLWCLASSTCGICCCPTWITTTLFERTCRCRRTRLSCALCTELDVSSNGLSSVDCIISMSAFDFAGGTGEEQAGQARCPCHHRRSLGGKSPAQSEQWYCRIARRRQII